MTTNRITTTLARRARRDQALARSELRQDSVERTAPASPTSFPVKSRDHDLERQVEAFLARRDAREQVRPHFSRGREGRP